MKGLGTVTALVLLQPSPHYLRSICMQSESMCRMEVPMASFAEDREEVGTSVGGFAW